MTIMDRNGRKPFFSATELAHVCGLAGFAVLLTTLVAWDASLVRWMLRLQMNDFGKFYYSTLHFLEGRDLYAESPATLIPVPAVGWLHLANMNPPHFHLLVLPLSFWGPSVALAGWILASLVSFALSVRVMVGDLGWPRPTLRHAGFVLLYFVGWVGTGSLIVTGQLSWLLLWPLTASWSAMRQGRWLTAGVLIGLLASVKPFLLLLLVYFVIRRQLHGLVGGLAAFVSAFLVGLAVFGYSAHVSWLAALGTMNWSWAAMNGSLLGFLSRLLAPSPASAPLVNASGLVYSVWLLAAVMGVALTLRSILRRPEDADRAFALLLLACLLFSPLGWVYYVWFLVPPLIAIAKRGLMARQRALVAFALLAALCPTWLTSLGQPSGLATLTVGSVYFWGFLSLWVALIRDSSHRDSARTP